MIYASESLSEKEPSFYDSKPLQHYPIAIQFSQFFAVISNKVIMHDNSHPFEYFQVKYFDST